MSIQSVPSDFDPNQAENLVDIEKQFAVVAVKHAQVYWSLLEKVDPKLLRLSKLDDEIFEHFKTDFPELFEDVERIANLDEDDMKSDKNKVRWRKFIEKYEKRVDNYNFGSLLRASSRGEYSESNSIFVTRMQFFAIEIARNRLGLNDEAHRIAKAEAQTPPS